MKRSIVIIMNIPSPYRTAFFNILDQECKHRGIELTVFYCAISESDRHWSFDENEHKYRFEFLQGFHPYIVGIPFHINPSAFSKVRMIKPDIVLFGGSWNMPTNFIVRLAVCCSKTKKIFWSEGHVDAVRNPTGPVAWMRRFILRGFDSFAVPNKKSAEWIKIDLKSDKDIIMLPNTVQEDFFIRTKEDQKLVNRLSLGIPENEKLLVQVSQLESRKGIEELVNAFLCIDNHLISNTKLVLIGEGSLRKSIERKIRDYCGPGKVLITGHISQDKVRMWLHAADWFVLNTKFDPNPLSVIEASFSGISLLVSAKAGNSQELVIPGVTGFLINNPLNPQAELKQALQLPSEHQKKFGLNASINAQKSFMRIKVAKDFLDQINTFMNRS